MTFKCANCGTEISKQAFFNLWEKDEVAQNVVTEDDVREELAEERPYLECPECEGPENILRDVLGEEEETEVQEPSGASRTEMFTDFSGQ